MARENEPIKKSRLSIASSFHESSTDISHSTSKGLITKSSSAFLAILACVTIALTIPHLHPQVPSEEIPSVIVTDHTNGTTEASPWTPQRRDNQTIEAALEAAVMGAFLADAASLGVQG